VGRPLRLGRHRKGRQVPSLSHLLAVSALLQEDGGDEDQAIAALLHDAIEDEGVSADHWLRIILSAVLVGDVRLAAGAVAMGPIRGAAPIGGSHTHRPPWPRPGRQAEGKVG
jgi:hypothetical protein